MKIDPNDLQPDQVKIVIRLFNQDKDQAFIYATWRNQAYYSALIRPEDPSSFFRQASHNIKKILETANVRVACLYDSPDTIIGYAVYTLDHLNWIYVKDDYREMGIGTMLWPQEIKSVTCYLTKIGAKIADKKNLILKENKYETYH